MTDLKVIGAGLGRTGTKSLQQALVLLGFGPCHHMTDYSLTIKSIYGQTGKRYSAAVRTRVKN